MQRCDLSSWLAHHSVERISGFISLKILGLLVLTGWAGIAFSRQVILRYRMYGMHAHLCPATVPGTPRHADSIITIHHGVFQGLSVQESRSGDALSGRAKGRQATHDPG